MDKISVGIVKFLVIIIFILLFLGVFYLGKSVGNAPWYINASMLILLIFWWVYAKTSKNKNDDRT